MEESATGQSAGGQAGTQPEATGVRIEQPTTTTNEERQYMDANELLRQQRDEYKQRAEIAEANKERANQEAAAFRVEKVALEKQVADLQKQMEVEGTKYADLEKRAAEWNVKAEQVDIIQQQLDAIEKGRRDEMLSIFKEEERSRYDGFTNEQLKVVYEDRQALLQQQGATTVIPPGSQAVHQVGAVTTTDQLDIKTMSLSDIEKLRADNPDAYRDLIRKDMATNGQAATAGFGAR